MCAAWSQGSGLLADALLHVGLADAAVRLLRLPRQPRLQWNRQHQSRPISCHRVFSSKHLLELFDYENQTFQKPCVSMRVSWESQIKTKKKTNPKQHLPLEVHKHDIHNWGYPSRPSTMLCVFWTNAGMWRWVTSLPGHGSCFCCLFPGCVPYWVPPRSSSARGWGTCWLVTWWVRGACYRRGRWRGTGKGRTQVRPTSRRILFTQVAGNVGCTMFAPD